MGPAETTGCVACCTAPDAVAVAQEISALFGDVGYVVTAKTNDMQFRWLTCVDLQIELPSWDEGRVFSDIAELRWKRTAKGCFTILLLTEDEQRAPAGWERLGESWHVVAHQSAKEWIRLWGKPKQDWTHWVEARIPRALVYPVTKGTGTVQVNWVEYRDEQGTPRFIRLKEVR